MLVSEGHSSKPNNELGVEIKFSDTLKEVKLVKEETF